MIFLSNKSTFDLAYELTMLYEKLYPSSEELSSQDFAVAFCRDFEEIHHVIKAHQELLRDEKAIADYY